MGTNYYLHQGSAPCPTCEHDPADVLHIGKSSAGWCFSLNTYSDRGINSLDDWVREFECGLIKDEYGDFVTPQDMLRTITERNFPHPLNWTQSEYAQNSAEPGPNNLARHRVDGRHCIAHGDGTYDLMRGEFF